MLHAHPATVMPAEKAEGLAALLNAEEVGESDGWSYRPVYDPSGGSGVIVEIYDEDGLYLGTM